MKDEINEREWTDGVGKALKTIGAMIEKKERMLHQSQNQTGLLTGYLLKQNISQINKSRSRPVMRGRQKLWWNLNMCQFMVP